MTELIRLMRTPMSGEEDDRILEHASAITGKPIAPLRRTPCSTCPFRVCNAGAETPYTACDATATAWEGIKVAGRPIRPNAGVGQGSGTLCHNGADSRRRDWLVKVPAVRLCAGALVVQQREAIRYHDHGTSVLPESAIVRIVRQMFRPKRTVWLDWFKEMDRGQILDAAHPAISDPAIGHPNLEPPKPGEFD